MDVQASFKKYDYILNNKRLILAEKIIALLELWGKIDWASLHTMNVTLTAEWQLYMDIFRREMVNIIETAGSKIVQLNTNFKDRFDKLIYVVTNTWTNQILEKLLKVPDVLLNKEDMEFFNFEQVHLISVRLMKLCDSNCEDLALNLVTAFFMYLNSDQFNSDIKTSPDQMWFIYDIRVALLYKFKEFQTLEETIRMLNYQDGICFINRFVNKKPNLLKIWKYSQKIAILTIEMFLERTLNQPNVKYIFNQLLELYITINTSTDSLDKFCAKIKQLCDISDLLTLHNFCDFFKKIKNPKLKVFIVEIFIKTLTADMNELELQRNVQNLTKIVAATSRLAQVFCNLAKFMNDKIKVARECVLTAFSLEPTTERLDLLEVLAKQSGLQISNSNHEWKCKLHPPVLPGDEITWQCPECHEFMCKPQLDIPLKANLALNEAIQTLDLPETLCEDLIVCISNPRYQVLSWYLPWTVLHRLCLMYLKDPQATKNFVTELKFVDIDYSMFEGVKKEPLDEYAGIEKGYEKYLDKNFIPNEDEETEESKSENCPIEGEDYDPNSMESLKKILSIQNSQEEEMKKIQEDEFLGSRYSRNPRSILKSSFAKETTEHIEKENTTRVTRNVKRKLHGSEKGKSRKNKDRRSRDVISGSNGH